MLDMGATDVQRDGIREMKEGDNKRIELANTYFFKGRKSLTKGNPDEALRMFRASVAIHEEVYGTYDRRTARSYFFLAQTLSKHTDEFDRALTAYRRVFRVGLSLQGLGISKDGDQKYVQGAKRAIREILSDKKTFDTIAVETFFSSVEESVKLEKQGVEYTNQKDFEQALESFEKCFDIEEKAEGTFPLDLGHLYVRIAEVHGQKGDYGMAIDAYRSALTIYESNFGRDYADSIFCLQGIEDSLNEMNLSNAAIQEYSDSMFTSMKHCKKGDALFESQNFKDAVEEYEAAREIEEKSLGDYPMTASYIRRQLGLAFRALKDYDRAILELRAALSIHIFECGDDHESVVATLQDIRSVMSEKGYDFSSINKYMNTVVFSIKHERYGDHLLTDKKEFSEAIEEFQKSLGLEVVALGKFHLTQGALFKGIGDAFLQQENYDFAIVNYRNALVVYQQNLGMEHYYAISVLNSIGEAAHGIGLNTDRIAEYKKAVSESIAVEKTAENLINTGADGDAIAAYRSSVRKEGLFIGDYHLSTADLHVKIAKVLKYIGLYDGAIVSYRYILAINLKSLGMDHMNTECAYEDLVKVATLKGLKKEDATSYGKNAKLSIEHEDNGDEAMRNKTFEIAINHYKKAIEIEESFLGSNHLVTEGIIRKILECFKFSGKSGQAFHYYRKMIRIYMENSPPDYDATEMLHSLETTVEDLGLSEAQKKEYIDIVKESVKCEIDGDSAEEAKNYTKAIDSYSRCLMMEQSLLGMLHPSTWSVHKKIGSTFEKNGDIDSAIVSHSKALAILESYLGLKEKETTESFNDLLNATVPKTRQADSTQNKKASDSKESFGKSMEKRENKKHDKTKKKDAGNDIYSVFASLRADASRERNSREDEKMEILMGLARKWKEVDGMGTSSIMNNFTQETKHSTGYAQQNVILNYRNQPEQSSKPLGRINHDSPSKAVPKAEPEKDLSIITSNFIEEGGKSIPEPSKSTEPETDFSKELERANEMANVLKKPQSRKFKLKPRILSFSKKKPSSAKKGGIGKFIGRFGNRQKEDATASGEVTQQKFATNESSKDTQQEPAPYVPSKDTHPNPKPKPTQISGTKNVNDDIVFAATPLPGKKYPTRDIPEIPAFSASSKTERNYSVSTSDEKISNVTNIPEIPAFNFNRSSKPETVEKDPAVSTSDEKISLNMDIPEIPTFNAKRNSSHDTEDDPVPSISSDSSMSSYESYESA